ncbi:hypothetical protein IQ249_24405 [Lusitaniella coriacea LEGE 07157]|uniref:Transmembrane protein n=1 Tax=Lusitaniella coriacea LEGE 07157 TaxID=945747 RepID=A0A8J7E389_9CYAN|nr:hypothetical protein [Lusitaniella coriacea]MBE9119036.1 hypothetical protein [Lusitaniella coriacea LEGE 07157]
MLNSSERHPQQKLWSELSQKLQKLVDEHQFAVWTWMGASVLSVCLLGTVSLLDPGLPNWDEAQPSQTSTGNNAPATPEVPLSLWTALVLLLASGTGSFIFTYALRHANGTSVYRHTASTARYALKYTVKGAALSSQCLYTLLRASSIVAVQLFDAPPASRSRPKRRKPQLKKRSRVRDRATVKLNGANATLKKSPKIKRVKRKVKPKKMARKPAPVSSSALAPQAQRPKRQRPKPSPVISRRRHSRRSSRPQPAAQLELPTYQNLALKPQLDRDLAPVTVVPQEEVVSLDRRERSLAEAMDVRKRRPLDTLMNKQLRT